MPLLSDIPFHLAERLGVLGGSADLVAEGAMGDLQFEILHLMAELHDFCRQPSDFFLVG